MVELLIVVFVVFFLLFLVSVIIVGILTYFENWFILFFKRPVYIHFYPFIKKLNPNQLQILVNHVPFYFNLSNKKKRYFEHRVVCFLSKYEFHARGDFEITEMVRIRIAATAIMLTFGMRNYLFNVIDKIIVYPSVYFSQITKEYHKGEFNPGMRALVFSWEDFESGWQERDNLNLGIHEFSHALHFHGLRSNDASAKVFSSLYYQINEMIRNEDFRQSLIDSGYFRIYGFTNQYEFLAVILEHYFETPIEFKSEFPLLFKQVGKMLNHRNT